MLDLIWYIVNFLKFWLDSVSEQILTGFSFWTNNPKTSTTDIVNIGVELNTVVPTGCIDQYNKKSKDICTYVYHPNVQTDNLILLILKSEKKNSIASIMYTYLTFAVWVAFP